MSSILTNQSAMTALRTLTVLARDLAQTRVEIATGKSVATARDNGAVWAISKTMESDVAGFKQISESLNLGLATLSVARQGAETVSDLLTNLKAKVVTAQEDNIDRVAVQRDVVTLRDQIGAVVAAAQFNGLNLLSNTDQTAGTGTVNILASLDRGSGGVSASDIEVRKRDLGLGASAIGAGLVSLTGVTNNLTGAGDGVATALTGVATGTAANTGVTTLGTSATESVVAGTGYSVVISASASIVTGAAFDTATGNEINYVARDGDTMTDVASAVAAAFNRYMEAELGADTSIGATASSNVVTFAGAVGEVGTDFSLMVSEYTAHASSTIGGGLSSLADYDVSTAAGADAALADIDRLIDTAVSAAASFGSAETRLMTQRSFTSGLTDALTNGIGTLVDANLEETSARLQALQVQQQLGFQAMAIANRSPEAILGLFQ